jgi:Cys-tRNA(Pro)/Cys-tRNA(Cys) deacylase
MTGSASAGTPATKFLTERGVDFRLHSYVLDVAADTYGEAVAAALGVAPERLFKTLIAEVDGSPVVAIVPVSSRLSLKLLARAAGGKRAAMAKPEVAERNTGYVTGGISPFGQRRSMPVFVDETVVLFDTVVASGGRRGLQIEVAAADLVTLLDASLADLME